jgi:tetrapyrrole methylase family protein/MazG family protein
MTPQTRNIRRLLQIVARLRGPGGCPWDREQTHRSIRHNLIEECYEVLEALDAGDTAAFKEELGDLLMQVVFHSQMAGERGRFGFDDVAKAIADKLVRRHPHVFGPGRLKTSAEVLRQWEAIKRDEKRASSIISGIPKHLPALLKADKIQRKVARVGFDWKRVDDVVAKVEEEWCELRAALRSRRRERVEEELGDLLFAVVNLARFQNLHAEQLLDKSVKKFARRFQQIERTLRRSGRRFEDCTLEEMDAIWESAKRADRSRRTAGPNPRRRARRSTS